METWPVDVAASGAFSKTYRGSLPWGGEKIVSIDKVVIQGAEFTRVADRYLLQSEVEQALMHIRNPTPHVERLTTLLEDIVNAADAVALEVLETQSTGSTTRLGEATGGGEGPAKSLLGEVRSGLRDQISRIDEFMHRLDG